jgi:hypothetical protein
VLRATSCPEFISLLKSARLDWKFRRWQR